jgi:hypothetical protein
MDSKWMRFCRRIAADVVATHRQRAAALTCVEERELENIFALLLLGSFVGLPAPPTFLAVELLPFMQKEIRILNRRAEDASDMLAVLMGSLGADG